MVNLTQLVFDTSVPNGGHNVGAYLRDANGNLITSTLNGSKQALDVNVVNGPDDGFFAEDSAHSTAHLGQYVLAVLQGTLASSADDGDYGSFKTDLLGRLWVNRSGQSSAHGATSVLTTATDIIGTDLANRIKVIIQNLSTSRSVYIGNSASVTAANGIELSPKASIELEVGPGVNLHGIAVGGSADVRYFEVA